MKKKIGYLLTIIFLIGIIASVSVVRAETYENYEAAESVSCGQGLITDIPSSLPKVVNIIYTAIQIAVPIVLVILGMLDLFKGITGQKEDDIKKGQQMLIKRLIPAAIIFFVLAIVKVVTSLIADDDNKTKIIDCVDCFINNDCIDESYAELKDININKLQGKSIYIEKSKKILYRCGVNDKAYEKIVELSKWTPLWEIRELTDCASLVTRNQDYTIDKYSYTLSGAKISVHQRPENLTFEFFCTIEKKGNGCAGRLAIQKFSENSSLKNDVDYIIEEKWQPILRLYYCTQANNCSAPMIETGTQLRIYIPNILEQKGTNFSIKLGKKWICNDQTTKEDCQNIGIKNYKAGNGEYMTIGDLSDFDFNFSNDPYKLHDNIYIYIQN